MHTVASRAAGQDGIGIAGGIIAHKLLAGRSRVYPEVIESAVLGVEAQGIAGTGGTTAEGGGIDLSTFSGGADINRINLSAGIETKNVVRVRAYLCVYAVLQKKAQGSKYKGFGKPVAGKGRCLFHFLKGWD